MRIPGCVLVLFVASIPYTLWLDRRMVGPKDGCYHLGAWLMGLYADRAGRKAALTLAVGMMCAGAVVGATMSRFAVAPVIGLAALTIAASLAIFRQGPRPVPSAPAEN